jgi:hypothetical protein
MLSPLDRAVTSRRQHLQHRSTNHSLKCPECDEELTSKCAVDQVDHLLIYRLSTDTISHSALRHGPSPLDKVSHVQLGLQDAGGDGSGSGLTSHSAVPC